MGIFQQLFAKVHKAVKPKRQPPRLVGVEQTHWAAHQYSNHANFWNDITDPIVLDTFHLLAEHWGYIHEHDKLVLSDEWTVEDMDPWSPENFVFQFSFNGQPLFKVGRLRGNLTAKVELRPLVDSELRGLIMKVLDEHKRL